MLTVLLHLILLTLFQNLVLLQLRMIGLLISKFVSLMCYADTLYLYMCQIQSVDACNTHLHVHIYMKFDADLQVLVMYRYFL